MSNPVSDSAQTAPNCCEHGDHPAPAGQRFCSPQCQACEGSEHDATRAACASVCEPLWTATALVRSFLSIPCDVYTGPCACGAWHEERSCANCGHGESVHQPGFGCTRGNEFVCSCTKFAPRAP